jgi:RNA polymerase sigma factor (sigma-70 family)
VNGSHDVSNFEEHLAYVKYIATYVHNKYPIRGLDLEDVIQEGVLGLFDAYKRFDPKREVAFTTYARYRIKGAILDSFRRWLPCDHQIAQDDRIELINSFEYASREAERSRCTEDLTDALRGIDIKDTVSKLLQTITNKEATVVKLSVCSGYTRQEISELLGISKAEISKLRHNALVKLRDEVLTLNLDLTNFKP